jgi:O-methyltransferase
MVLGASALFLLLEYLQLYRDTLQNRHYLKYPNNADVDGSIAFHTWPPGANAMTMAGQRRLDHTVAIIATAIADGIPGHFIETGVWRGGMSFMAAKALEVLATIETERTGVATPPRLVYLCDSFAGIPEQTSYGRGRDHVHPASGLDRKAHSFGILNDNSVDRVREDAARVNLGPTLRWVPGYFNESLPRLARDEPSLTFLTIRLDGDAYWSTYEALTVLYPRLSPGENR